MCLYEWRHVRMDYSDDDDFYFVSSQISSRNYDEISSSDYGADIVDDQVVSLEGIGVVNNEGIVTEEVEKHVETEGAGIEIEDISSDEENEAM